MRLEINELRALQAVVETNGFGRAADKLHISQSAVSQAIASLETKLQMPLLRRGKPMVLTKGGSRLWEYANDVLRQEQKVLEDLTQLRSGEKQVIRLGINSTINRFHGPTLIASFFATVSPATTTLKVSELPSRELVYRTLAGDIDFAIGPFQKGMDAFRTQPLFNETRHLVISPAHPQYQAMMAGDKQSLTASPLITSALDSPEMRPAIQRIRDRFSSVWEVSSLNLRISMVQQGLGAAYIDNKLLESLEECREFAVLKALPFASIERQAGIYYRREKSMNDASEHFIELCRQHWAE